MTSSKPLFLQLLPALPTPPSPTSLPPVGDEVCWHQSIVPGSLFLPLQGFLAGTSSRAARSQQWPRRRSLPVVLGTLQGSGGQLGTLPLSHLPLAQHHSSRTQPRCGGEDGRCPSQHPRTSHGGSVFKLAASDLH